MIIRMKKIPSWWLIFICLLLPHLFLHVLALGSNIKTSQGSVVGKSIQYNGNSVRAFLGIPYAKPPVGDLRFKKPVPIDPWTRSLQAKDYKPSCIQSTTPDYPWVDSNPNQDEDCLYLNIWVPPSTNKNSKKPVMFWLFSGGFATGSGRLPVYDGSVLAAEGDVIVVTVNYRLSILGFLSTDTHDDDAPGNMGFFDMVEALKWVIQNIQKFGGDPDNITVFGQSAGSISTGYFITSPLTDGMFQKAIMESGAPAFPANDNSKNNNKLAQQVAQEVGCAILPTEFLTNQKKVIKCFKEKDAKQLVETTAKLKIGVSGFDTVTGDPFLPVEPNVQLKTGTFKKVKIMIGFVQDEGSFTLGAFQENYFGSFGEKNPQTTKAAGAHVIKKALKDLPTNDLVVKYYLGDVKDDDYDKIRKQSYHAIGDFMIVCPALYYTEGFAKKGLDVYAYYFKHVPSVNPWARWLKVAHFSEVPFVFGRPLDNPGKYTAAEKGLSRKMIGLWSNFAKTGSPGDNWKKYSISDPYFYVFNISNREDYFNEHKKNCDFFRPLVGNV